MNSGAQFEFRGCHSTSPETMACSTPWMNRMASVPGWADDRHQKLKVIGPLAHAATVPVCPTLMGPLCRASEPSWVRLVCSSHADVPSGSSEICIIQGFVEYRGFPDDDECLLAGDLAREVGHDEGVQTGGSLGDVGEVQTRSATPRKRPAVLEPAKAEGREASNFGLENGLIPGVQNLAPWLTTGTGGPSGVSRIGQGPTTLSARKVSPPAACTPTTSPKAGWRPTSKGLLGRLTSMIWRPALPQAT